MTDFIKWLMERGEQNTPMMRLFPSRLLILLMFVFIAALLWSARKEK